MLNNNSRKKASKTSKTRKASNYLVCVLMLTIVILLIVKVCKRKKVESFNSYTNKQNCNTCVRQEGNTLYKIWDTKKNKCIDYTIGGVNLNDYTNTKRNKGNFVIPGESSKDPYWTGELFKDDQGCEKAYNSTVDTSDKSDESDSDKLSGGEILLIVVGSLVAAVVLYTFIVFIIP